MDEQELQGYIDSARRGNLTGKSAARYFELSGLTGSNFEAAMSAMPADVNPNAFIEEPETREKDPYAGFNPMGLEEIQTGFDTDLNLINSAVVQQTEEESVTFLNSKYGRYGFKFDEAVPGLDFIKVSAPNGKVERFRFGQYEQSPYEQEVEREYQTRTEDLVSFMNKNMIEDPKKVNDLAKANYLDTTVFDNQDAIQGEAKEIEGDAQKIQEQFKNYRSLQIQLSMAESKGNQQDVDRLSGELRDMKQDLQNQQGALNDRSLAFEGSVGRYFSIKENQGTLITNALYPFLGPGVEKVVEGISEIGILAYKIGMSPASIKSLSDQNLGKLRAEAEEMSDWSDYSDTVRGGLGLTEESVRDFTETNLWTEVWSGATESLPSFISPSRYFNVLALAGSTLKTTEEMMSGEEWEDVSEESKLKFTAPMVLTQVVLERLGFSRIKSVNSFVLDLVAKALGRSAKTAGKVGAKAFAEFVEQDVKSAVARAGLVSGNAFIAEAETGFLQEVSSEGLKNFYNKYGEKTDIFKVAETLGEFGNQVLTAALHEGLGGLLLGAPVSFRAASNNFSDEDMTRIMAYRNDLLLEFKDQRNRQKVLSGEITAKQYADLKKRDQQLGEIAKQIPSDANLSTQKQLFRKLQRSAALKSEISNKGSLMSSRESQELKNLQSEINDIGNNYDKLTPEQKGQELREVTQPINPTGGVSVQAADGSTVEITPEELSEVEVQRNEKMEEAPESEEGVQFSLFDETSDQPVDQQPTVEADPSDFAEIKVSEATPESMEAAGFSTEFQSLISKVKDSVGDAISRNKGDKFVNHKTSASILGAVRNIDSKEAAMLQFGDFVFGFVHAPKDGGPQQIHLLDTNTSEFTEQVRDAAKKLGVSYKIASAVDLVTEEVVTHYMLQDFFGVNGTKRQEFYNELEKLSESNPALKKLIEDTEMEYSDFSEAKQQEEVIAAFFKDYVKSPSTYRNVWQRIADWFNNTFRKGTRVINNESDLMSVARNVSNIISGVDVDIQAPSVDAQDSGVTLSRASGSNYLQNETVYYKFDRNAGVEYTYWATKPDAVGSKVKVNDYFHFRNWYNKMTANQEQKGVITDMYFIKDGKKVPIRPPKPKFDKQGNKVEMKRVMSSGDIVRARNAREKEDLRTMRLQFSTLMNEAQQLFRDSGLNKYLKFMDFVPEGALVKDYAYLPMTNTKGMYMEGLDFEGYIIAKKNIQALVNSGISEEELKGANRFNRPELFNMGGIERFAENEDVEGSDGSIVDPISANLDIDSNTDSDSPSISYSRALAVKQKSAIKTPYVMVQYDPGITGEFELGGKTYYTKGGVMEHGVFSDDPILSEVLTSHSDPGEQTKAINKLLSLWNIRHRFGPFEKNLIEERNEKQEALKKSPANKSIQKDLNAIEHQLKEARRYRKALKESPEFSVLVSLNSEGSLIARPDVFRAMMIHAIDYFESRPKSEQDVFLKDFNEALATGKISNRKLSCGEYYAQRKGSKPFVKVGPNGKKTLDYRVQDLALARDIIELLSHPKEGSFEARDSFIHKIKVYGSRFRKEKKISDIYYRKFTKADGAEEFIFPSRRDVNEMLVDPNLKDVLLASTEQTVDKEGNRKEKYHRRVYAVITGNIDGVFMINEATKNPSPVVPAPREESSFPYATSGKVEIFRLDKPIDIPENSTLPEGSKTVTGKGILPGLEYAGFAFSRASGRLSSKVADMSGGKGVSVNQLLQILGKASSAERAVVQKLIERFPGQDFISKEDFDMFFEGKMLQPLEEERNHANYGLDRLLGRSYRQADAVTVPFLGDKDIYGSAGIFEDHFDFPVHAHLRMFTHPNDPGVRYVSEIQSDTYQKGLDQAYDGTITNEIIIEEAGSDELGIAVQNLDFLKYIVDNYEQYRTLLIVAAGGKDNAMSDKFWDDLLQEVEVVSEDRINDAPNVASLLRNSAINNPSFNVRALRATLKHYALSELKAPIGSTDKQIEAIIDETFNKYPFVQEGEKSNLGRFATDLAVTVDYITMSMSSLVAGEDMQYMSQEERTKAYSEVVEEVERNKKKKEIEKVEGLPSAEKSWEKQLIRYAVRQAQENGEAVVRFPTEKTAADIQWWDSSDIGLQEYVSQELGVDGLAEAPDVYDSEEIAKQRPLRKRYRDIPKTLKSIGLESRVAQDQQGNRWYEVDVPPSDQRMIMFSRVTGKNNMGDVGGATWEARQRTSTQEWSDMWLTRLQDKYRKVFQLQEDVSKKTEGQVKKDEDFRMAEELMYGKAAEDLAKLDDATDRITMTLLENKLTVEELDEYMYALHAKERNAVINDRTEGKNQMGSGISNLDAQKILDGKSEEKKQQLEEAASVVREIMQNTRDTMVKLGLESQETIDAFEKMFKDYVPLQGKSVDEEDLAYSPYPNGGTGFSVSGATTKKAKGRFTQTTNIVAQAIGQNAAVHVKGRTNEAMNALYNLAQNNPNSNVWQVLDKEEDGYKSDDPNIVSVRVNGVQKAIRFKDASYAQSLRKMNMPQTNYFVKAMGSMNSWLRAAFTSRNPEFILSNFSRDIQSAVFNASAESEIEGGFLNGTAAMKRVFKLVGPSLKTLVKDEVGGQTDPLIMKYYEEFKADGGKTGWAYQKSLEDIASQLQVDDSGKTAGQKIIGGVKGALEFVEGMNDAFENSIRLSSYIAAREGGVSREKAAQFAKNITVNFNKQGEWGAAVNATYLFFNAAVQGTSRIGRSLSNLRPPVKPDGSRREWYERATTAQKAAGGMVIMNALLTLLNRAASDEDEDGTLFYSKIPDYVKERNMIIMRPDGENYWKIPMPYGYNIFANIGTTSVEVASGDREALEGLAFMAMSIVNAFSPVSFGQSENLGTQLAKTSIPTAFKPFFEAFAFNETYFGGPVKAEQYPFGTPKPNSSMSFRSPEEIKQFFSWMNEATGGSEDVPGIIDINPDGGWYIFEYFLGGTGKFVTRSIETGRKIVADRAENPIDLDFNDIPFARIVYGEPSKYYDMQLFKEREVEVKQLVAEYKENRIPDAGDRYKGIGQLNEDLKKINKALKAVRSEKRAAKKISAYGERVSTLQKLMDRERRLVMMFNQRYEQFRGEN